MAGYADLGQIALQNEFLLRIRCALYVAAIDVFAEDAGTTNHAQRLVYAAKVTSNQFDLSSVANSVLTNATIAAEANANIAGNSIPDSDIQFSLNSVFDALAGV